MPWWRQDGVAWVIAGAVVLLPSLTWMPLTSPHSPIAVLQTPHWLFACVGLLVLGIWLAETDGWLGLLVAWGALRAIPASYPGTFEAAYGLAFGAVLLVLMRRLTDHRVLVWPLLLMGVFQVGYASLQAWGVDLIWCGGIATPPESPVPTCRLPFRAIGTLGNENYLGAYLGVLVPLSPWWLWPIFGVGLAVTHSLTGTVAALAGLTVRYRAHVRWWGWLLLVGVAGGVAVWSWPVSGVVRWRVWMVAWADTTWATALFGHGLGAWAGRFTVLQPYVTIGEVFRQAHNEYVQWGYEAGLFIGLGLVVGWLWRHRRLFLGPYAGAVTAILLTAATGFPFHLAIPGLTDLAILGLATAPKGETT